MCPERIEMVDVLEDGKRPVLRQGRTEDPRLAEATRVCPGNGLRHTFDRSDPALVRELLEGWGPVREVWEGHATNQQIRLEGSSGGVTSALALYCIEHGGMYGVVHTAARPDVPYLNHTVFSTTRQQIRAAAGSRYAPASPCDGLKRIEEAAGPCVFIGKPCDVAATQMAARLRSGLRRNLGLTIGVFCGGTPSTRGTLELLRRLDVAAEDVDSLRYRGCGWPGMTGVRLKGPSNTRREMTYQDAWDTVLTRYKPFRCHACPDGTGEFADVACGDPWYRTVQLCELGSSLIVVRTELGQRILRGAMDEGCIVAQRRPSDVLPRSQPGLLSRRRHVFPKAVAMRMLGLPFPKFSGFGMLRGWLRLPWGRVVVSLLRAFRYAISLSRKSSQQPRAANVLGSKGAPA